MNDFERFARSQGISSLTLQDYTGGIIAPSVLEERKSFMASYDIFSKLLDERIIFLGCPINDDVANIIQAELLYLSYKDSKKDISLYVNTPGGYVHSGLAIYDTMQLIDADVSTICTGMAASMGSIILAGGTTGKRKILPHSRVMIHQPLGGATGQASDILIAAEEIKKCKDTLYTILSKHTNQSIEKITEDADRDFWMSAEEALDYHIVDIIR